MFLQDCRKVTAMLNDQKRCLRARFGWYYYSLRLERRDAPVAWPPRPPSHRDLHPARLTSGPRRIGPGSRRRTSSAAHRPPVNRARRGRSLRLFKSMLCFGPFFNFSIVSSPHQTHCRFAPFEHLCQLYKRNSIEPSRDKCQHLPPTTVTVTIVVRPLSRLGRLTG